MEGWTGQNWRRGIPDCRGTEAEEDGAQWNWSREGGVRWNWSRGGWRVAELERRRAGARWNRAGVAEQRLCGRGTTRDELQWGQQLRALSEMIVLGIAASSSRDLRWRQ
ncbi:hypothetical protein AAHE18_03G318300 [Arachis hypogaea]